MEREPTCCDCVRSTIGATFMCVGSMLCVNANLRAFFGPHSPGVKTEMVSGLFLSYFGILFLKKSDRINHGHIQ